jgi:DNA recombination-dependent growth factor C
MKFDQPMKIKKVYTDKVCKLENDFNYPSIMLKKVEKNTIKHNVMEDLISGEIF